MSLKERYIKKLNELINWSTNKVKLKNWIRENDLQGFFQEDLDKITKTNVENGILDNLAVICIL